MTVKRLCAVLKHLTVGTTYAYAGVVLILLVLIRWVGDEWPPVTLILLMPRWLLLVPAGLLVVISGLLGRPRDWLLQGTVALVVAGPFMGLTVPWRRVWLDPPAGTKIRILTYNVAQNAVDPKRLIALLEEEHVDVICFQEGRIRLRSIDPYFEHGWYQDRSRRVASRFPIVEKFTPLPQENLSGERNTAFLNRIRVSTPTGAEFVLASVHLPTLRPGFYRAMECDFEGLRMHRDWWRSELRRVLDQLAETESAPMLLAGDFNMPDDDSTMASLSETFHSAFAEAGWAYGYTRPSRLSWVRIDHIFGSPEWTFLRCWVGPDLGSDHLPMLADAVLTTDRSALASAADHDSLQAGAR